MIVPDGYHLLEEPYHINTYALISKSRHYNIIALGTPIDARIWDAELMETRSDFDYSIACFSKQNPTGWKREKKSRYGSNVQHLHPGLPSSYIVIFSTKTPIRLTGSGEGCCFETVTPSR